jgi:hypothetical protein
MTIAHFAVSQDLVAHLPITGSTAWFAYYDIELDEAFFEDTDLVQKHEIVGKIIALQVSYFLVRMMSFMGDGQSDAIYAILGGYVQDYKNKFGEEFPDPNGELIHGHL